MEVPMEVIRNLWASSEELKAAKVSSTYLPKKRVLNISWVIEDLKIISNRGDVVSSILDSIADSKM